MKKVAIVILLLMWTPLVSGNAVLFDHTKSEDVGKADWVIDGAYSDWADDLRSLGYTVEELSLGEKITYGDPDNPKDLSKYDVFILPEPQNPFTDEERTAILNFIKNGGTLIYIADHKSSDRDSDGWDSWSIWNDNLDFDSLFGITLLSTQIPSDTVITDIKNIENLTNNVSKFGIWLGTAISVTGNAKAVAWYKRSEGYAAWAYTTYGNGKVIVFPDSSTFSDGSCKTSCAGYDDYHKYDDKWVAINMVRFAATSSGSGSQENGGTNNQSTPQKLVVINEIMYNPVASDDLAEWVELYNPNNFTVDVSGWSLKDNNGGVTFTQGTEIPPQGYLVVCRNTSWLLNHYSSDKNFNPNNVYQENATFQLSNSGDTITLKDRNDEVIDEVKYDDSWGADGNGKSLERIDPLGNSSNPNNWAESSTGSSSSDGGTPTYRNTQQVPFFGTPVMVAVFLFILILLRK